MKAISLITALLFSAAPAFAALATTTRYDDGQEGACGCGSTSGAFSWQYEIATNVYTAAGSQVLFDTGGSSWCGAGCGTCYNLTNQGYSACTGCGASTGAGESIIVMVTNLCPNNGNAQWCPVVGGTNEYGYSAHFDIMSKDTALVLGTWDNPVVSYEEVACPTQAVSDWSQCICDATSTTVTSASTSKASSSTTTTASKASTTTSKASGTTTTSKASTTTTTATTGGGTAPLYGQCGGLGWTGGTVCASGTCTYSNPYYSQCLP